jgi:large repetitive protein
MNSESSAKPFRLIKRSAALFAVVALSAFGSLTAHAAPLSISVVGVDQDNPNAAPVPLSSYRWTVEEDATKLSVPGQAATPANYSFSFHTSYMPVVASGRSGAARTQVPAQRLQDPDYQRMLAQSPGNLNLDPCKRYFVSITAQGYQMGGASVVFNGACGGATAGTATVKLNKLSAPTAQLSVLVFNDNSPLNGAPDLPQEGGLAGFHVHLVEAGGTYGASGGEVTQDGFGNPLGTTYSDDQGTVATLGSGIMLSDANGVVIFKNLYPAKYTIFVTPPPGSDWHQTSTIEGTKGTDAWVKNNEPARFLEFGPPGYHVFMGFTKTGCVQGTRPSGVCLPVTAGVNNRHTIKGKVVSAHDARPTPANPAVGVVTEGPPVADCWVALNDTVTTQTIYTARCKSRTSGEFPNYFEIPNIPNGTYELVVWDDPLDTIIGFTSVTVNGSDLNLGNVAQLNWFGRYQGRVFQDIDGTGLPYFQAAFDKPYIQVDPVTGIETEVTKHYAAGELKPGFGSGVASNIRFRDGSIYQSVVTKKDGTFAFTEVFPFFNWMVAEIDYARFKATSAVSVVDDGGAIDAATNLSRLWGLNPSTPYTGLFGSNDVALAYNPWARLNPQLQADGDCPIAPCYFRLESVENGPGAVLLEGMQLMGNQTNHIEWGKQPYNGKVANDLSEIVENGGIAGIVQYAITRAEDDPRYAAAETWEPGIPRVQVNLYIDCDGDGIPDKPKNDGSGQCVEGAAGLSTQGYVYQQADVDNYPFGWRDGGTMGPEDVKRSGAGTTFSEGDIFKWGNTSGSGSQLHRGLGSTDAWDDAVPEGCRPNPTFVIGSGPAAGTGLDCFEGLANFNQVRPSLFDGGYAFGRVAGQAELPMLIGKPSGENVYKGTYVVEAVAPPGYLHQGSGDQNVAFGETLKSSAAALPFECVGQTLDVPSQLVLFPGEDNAPPLALDSQGKWRKCDMKAVPLLPGTNPAPNFFLFTEAPIAAHGMGMLTDDINTSFDTLSPGFGEKYSPPYVPISVRDWTGQEITRVYSDQYGRYNFLVPSSYTINPPYPSGVMPNMLQACINHPGPIADPAHPGQTIIDPYFNRGYTQICYTLQFLAGKTTYLDTPMLPVAAFASVEKTPLDCDCDNGTPEIYTVTNTQNPNRGPWVAANNVNQRNLTITSRGLVEVSNPTYDPAASAGPKSQKLITRDHGFGAAQGTVRLGNISLNVQSWSDGVITVAVPSGANGVPNGQHQLSIVRGDNSKETVVGLTVHVGGGVPILVNPAGTAGGFKSIQAAIDSAAPGQLITIAPGTYEEFVILDKRVRLQGWGAGSTFITTAASKANGQVLWRQQIDARAAVPTFDMLPGQSLGINPLDRLPLLFGSDEGPGVLVVGKAGPNNGCLGSDPLMVDGLTITGSTTGGGVLASGYACNLQVSNNRMVSNYGTYGGGVRIGHTALVDAGGNFVDGVNPSVTIHHNWVSQNGAAEGGGAGGITLGTGSSNYNVSSNYVCGNISLTDGGGIAHIGRSASSISGSSLTNTIAKNTIVFNQSFNQTLNVTGGGLFISGQLPADGGAGVNVGTGDILVDGNLFQGNQAGAGAGGGVSIAHTLLGDDVVLNNNMIVNNVSGYAGGGVAMLDVTENVVLVNNTVADNASSGSSQQSFGPGGVTAPSLPQVAGVVLLDPAARAANRNPQLLNNILWGNRSFIYNNLTGKLANPSGPNYRDLGTLEGNATGLTPRFSVLSATTANQTAYGVDANLCGNGGNARCNKFVAGLGSNANNNPLFIKATNFTESMLSAATVDEGGNFVSVIFSPITLWDFNAAGTMVVPSTLRANYHLKNNGNAALNNGRAYDASTNASLNIGANFVPSKDFDGQTRTGSIDIGADEVLP